MVLCMGTLNGVASCQSDEQWLRISPVLSNSGLEEAL